MTVDSDQMPHSVASDLDLHYLLRSVSMPRIGMVRMFLKRNRKKKFTYLYSKFRCTLGLNESIK